MFSFRKRFHIHKWITLQEVFYRTGREEEMGLTTTPEIRTCKVCGKSEYLEVHCAGLNPPTYFKDWIEINGKPCIRNLISNEENN